MRHRLGTRVGKICKTLLAEVAVTILWFSPQSKEHAWTCISKAGAPWSPGARRESASRSPQAWPGKAHHVIITGRTEAGVNKAIAGVAAATSGDVVGFAGDLGTAAAAEEVVRRHRDIEILVNNLGIFEPKPFQEIQDSDWMRFFEVNVLSGVRLARLCLPGMKRANWGRIIFISSESALQIPVEMIHYGVT